MEKKRILFIIVICFMFFLSARVLALGVSPAKVTMDFVPGYSNTFEYTVKDVPSNSDVNLSLEGDLAKYASLDTTHLDGNGKFYVTLELPEEIETPGKNRIKVVAEEVPKKDDFGGMVGTSVTMKAAIDIDVPYPGKYLEIEKFRAGNVNLGETAVFELSLKNKGKENLSISPKIEIFDSDKEIVETLSLGEGVIEVTEEKEISKRFNTEDYNPGKYNATAIVDYGERSAKETIPFNIGELNIDIINHTKKYFVGEGLQRFDLEIESGWNDKIEGAYADVVISNNTDEVVDFKTSTTSLNPWKTEVISGYFDTSEFAPGDYEAKVILNYFGKDTGETKTKFFDMVFIEKDEDNFNEIIFVLSGALVLGIIVLAFLKFYLKRKKTKKKK